MSKIKTSDGWPPRAVEDKFYYIQKAFKSLREHSRWMEQKRANFDFCHISEYLDLIGVSSFEKDRYFGGQGGNRAYAATAADTSLTSCLKEVEESIRSAFGFYNTADEASNFTNDIKSCAIEIIATYKRFLRPGAMLDVAYPISRSEEAAMKQLPAHIETLLDYANMCLAEQQEKQELDVDKELEKELEFLKALDPAAKKKEGLTTQVVDMEKQANRIMEKYDNSKKSKSSEPTSEDTNVSATNEKVR